MDSAFPTEPDYRHLLETPFHSLPPERELQQKTIKSQKKQRDKKKAETTGGSLPR